LKNINNRVYTERGGYMKKLPILLFLLLLAGTVVVLLNYSRQSKTQIQESVSIREVEQFIPSPIPTVAQIPLTIVSPTNGSSVTNAVITVQGKSSVNAEVFVNDKETVADAQGNFSTVLTLDEGDNTILIVANNADGSYSEQQITITYNPA
jgi:hypothetical protein